MSKKVIPFPKDEKAKKARLRKKILKHRAGKFFHSLLFENIVLAGLSIIFTIIIILSSKSIKGDIMLSLFIVAWLYIYAFVIKTFAIRNKPVDK